MIKVLAGSLLFTFVACNSETSAESDKQTTETKASKDEDEKTEISVGPDGASLKSKNTDVKVSSEGASVGTKDVNVKVNTKDTTKN